MLSAAVVIGALRVLKKNNIFLYSGKETEKTADEKKEVEKVEVEEDFKTDEGKNHSNGVDE